jgi:hypothetical protein
MPGELQLEERTHTYRVDGVVLPSVTQVLEDVGIIDYSFLNPDDRAHYLQRGSAVHLATQLDDEGDLDEATVEPAIAPYLEAWRAFRLKSGFTPSRIEHRDYSQEYAYAGTLDRAGTFASKPATIYILDIKTGTAPWWVRVQLAAYAAFFEGPRKFPRFAVELHDDGTFRVSEEFPGRDWQKDFAVFTAALEVYRAKRRK